MKTIFIEGRQTGKTTRAIGEFLKNPSRSLLVVYNLGLVDHIKKRIGNYANIVSYDQFIKMKINFGIDNLIIDEYLLMNNKKEIYQNSYRFSNVVVFSTSNKLYNRELFDIIVSLRKMEYSFESIVHDLAIKQKFFTLEEISELVYNFITDPNYTIIHNMGGWEPLDRSEFKNELKGIFSDRQYRIEALGEYLTEKKVHNDSVWSELVEVKPLGPPSGMLFYFDYKIGTITPLKHFTEL